MFLPSCFFVVVVLRLKGINTNTKLLGQYLAHDEPQKLVVIAIQIFFKVFLQRNFFPFFFFCGSFKDKDPRWIICQEICIYNDLFCPLSSPTTVYLKLNRTFPFPELQLGLVCIAPAYSVFIFFPDEMQFNKLVLHFTLLKNRHCGILELVISSLYKSIQLSSFYFPIFLCCYSNSELKYQDFLCDPTPNLECWAYEKLYPL